MNDVDDWEHAYFDVLDDIEEINSLFSSYRHSPAIFSVTHHKIKTESIKEMGGN